MSIWTTIRDTIVKPAAAAVANVFAPGSGAIFSAINTVSTAPKVSVPNAVTTVRSGVNMSAYGVGRAVGVGAAALPGMAARVLPGVGTALAVAQVGSMVYDWVTGADGKPVKVSRKTGRVIGRRRSKGITGNELKSFTRVTHILNKYCKVAPPRRRASTRGKACR